MANENNENGPTAAQKYGLLTSIFSITGVVLLFVGSLNCNYVKFTDTSGTSEPVSLQYGIWNFLYWSIVRSIDGVFAFESCHYYGDLIEMDASWKAARAFSVLAFIFGILVIITSCITMCDNDPAKITPSWQAPLYLLTACFTGLTLLFLNSNGCHNNTAVKLQDMVLSNVIFPATCSMATGAKMAISSTVFFGVAAVTSFCGVKATKAEVAMNESSAGLDEPLNP